jgi:CRP-like cAMP-binding protein
VDAVTLLLGTYLFQDLTSAELQSLVNAIQVRSYAKGDAIFRTGDIAGELLVVAAGRVAYAVSSVDGQDFYPFVMNEAAVFGEPALFAPDRRRIVDAIAITPCVVVAIARDPLIRFLLSQPRAMLRLVEGLAAEARSGAVIIAELAFDQVRERLARRLVLLVDHAAPPTGLGVRLDISQEDLGRFVSATREHVNRALQSLAAEGLVELGHGYLIIVQPTELRARAAQGWPPSGTRTRAAAQVGTIS